MKILLAFLVLSLSACSTAKIKQESYIAGCADAAQGIISMFTGRIPGREIVVSKCTEIEADPDGPTHR